MSSCFTNIKKNNLIYLKSNYSGIRAIIDDRNYNFIESKITIKNPNFNERGHSLEHLIFTGSKNYPYPDSLSDLANYYYGFATGFSSKNLTKYHLNALNDQGYLRLLPVLLDAIFNPLLRESFFITEVHHIDGYGNDNGTVYNENRKKPFDTKKWPDNRDRNYFPDLAEIKEHHRDYYRMDNCIITIKGKVNPQDVIEVIEKFERENVLRNLSIALPDTSFNPDGHLEKINHIKVPVVSDLMKFNLFWRRDDITVAELHGIGILGMYYSEIILKTLNSVSSIKPMLVKVQKPFKFGFMLERISIADNHVDELIQKVMISISDEMIDLKKIKDAMKKYKPTLNFFDEVMLHQLYSDDKDDEFNFYSIESESSKLLEKDQDYWKNLARKFFKEDYTVVVYHPDEELINIQTENELSRIKKRKEDYGIEGLDKLAEKLSKSIERNKEFFSEKLDLKKFQNIEVTFNEIKQQKLENYCAKFIDIPINYLVDQTLSDQLVKFELIFDLTPLPADYYKFLMLYIKLIPVKLLENFKYSFKTLVFDTKIIKNRLIYSVKMRIDDTWKAGCFFKWLIKMVYTKCSWYKFSLKKYIYSGINGVTIDTTEKFIDNYILYDNKSINKYSDCAISMVNIHKKLLLTTDNKDDFSNLRKTLKSMNSFIIEKCNSNLNIYVKDATVIPKICLIKWPELCQNKNTGDRRDIKTYNVSYHVSKKYCILLSENYRELFKRYLPLKVPINPNDYYYLTLLNVYIGHCILSRTRIIYGSYYTSRILLKDSVSLVYKISAVRHLNQIEKLHRELIRDLILERKVDPQEFELAKRRCIYNSSTKLTMYNKLKDLDLNTVIDAVGQLYLDLFDDSKTALVILLPESLKEQSELYDGVEYRNIEDFNNE